MKSGSASGGGSPNSQHWKTFSLLVHSFRTEKKDERRAKIVQDVDKILQIMSKISDVSDLSSHPDTLVDLNWLLVTASSEVKSPLLWSVLALILRWCRSHPWIHRMMRDRFQLCSTLTPILLSLPTTTHERCLKLLEALRWSVAGLRLPRLESFVLDLIPKLLDSLDRTDLDAKLPCLFILTSLCRNNPLVTNFLLSYMEEQKRKAFQVEQEHNPRTQILLHFLSLLLSKATLFPSIFASGSKMDVTLICDAFCAAYSAEDYLQLELFADYLQTLQGSSSVLKESAQKSFQTLMQPLLLIVDFDASGNFFYNEALFRFLRQMFSLQSNSDLIMDLDTLVKTLQLRFEGSDPHTMIQPPLLLKDIVVNIKGGEMTESQLQNIKLQLESLVGDLCELVTSKKGDESKGKGIMVQTLCEVTCVSNWHEMVTAHLKPGKMLTKLDDLLLSRTQNPDSIGSSSSSNNPLMLICDIILLSKSLTERDNLWKSAYDVMVSKGDLTSYLLEHLKSSGCTKDESAKILKVLTKCKMSVSNGSEEHLLKNNNLDALEEDSRLFQDWEIEKKCPEKQVAKIEEVVENVSKYVENQEAHKNLSEIFELGDFRLLNHQRQIDNLKSSLLLADQRIVKQNEENEILAQELSKMTFLMKTAFQKSQITEEELSGIRIQFEGLQRDATSYRNRMDKENARKSEAISNLESDLKTSTTKLVKYKEQNETLQATIKEHIDVQEELQAKLKTEAKTVSDLNLVLEKREDKLRKKERQLEEEMSKRERLESDLSDLQKECNSLKTLTKRQEQALAKKEKQLQEQSEEMNSYRAIQEQIFNLSKKNVAK